MGALGLLGWAGCSGVGDDALGTDVVLSPTVVLVPGSQVTQSAWNSSDERPASSVLVIEGDDMMPRYPAGTALVIEPTDFQALRKGMTVAFRDGDRRIAHVLVAKSPEGWATRGLNAKQDDPVALTKSNYLGTVTMAFAAENPVEK
ncbi:MAG TPA: S24/S26 family peptidase [Opitutus sp.]|nr:S24/S26 family peptidase [Opitutus sp.]